MSSQTRRKSIHIGGFKHANPIPNACRIGNLADVRRHPRPRSGDRRDAGEPRRPMRQHVRAHEGDVEAAGGTTDDIIKMTVWLKDRTQRAPVNVEWLKMFPDEHSRPARHALQMDNMDGGALVQCDFTAVID